MRRWETLLALVAVVLASLSAMQIPGRLILALSALLLLSIVASARLRSMIRDREQKKPKGFSAYDRAMKIQKDRDDRLGKL